MPGENGDEKKGVRAHVLLIGIDAYPGAAALGGCVNDIDAMEVFLRDRLKLPEEAITKLAAPSPGAPRPHQRVGAAHDGTPDLASIQSALRSLAGDHVQLEDRVLIHYSGHGAQVLQKNTPFYREALVPVDFETGGVLYDQEINELVQAIAARTANLTLIFDCCHSAGATRGEGDPVVIKTRLLTLDRGVPALNPGPAGAIFEAKRGVQELLTTADPAYVLAAACDSDQPATERAIPTSADPPHGVFTWALLDVLKGSSDADLGDLQWWAVWPSILGRVKAQSPSQQPHIIGRKARSIFGASSGDREEGYLVTFTRNPPYLSYAIEGGSLTGLTEGALVAVYGPTPDRFPVLDSPEDRATRICVLEVTQASLSTAKARWASGKSEWPSPARGRLIRPGKADALLVGVDPKDRDLVQTMRNSGGQFLDVPPWSKQVEVRVVRTSDRSFELHDELYGPPGAEPAIARIPGQDFAALSRALNHYARYNLALRLPRRCLDLPRALEVTLLDCSDEVALRAAVADNPSLPLFPPDTQGRPGVRAVAGQSFCVKLWNHSTRRLDIALLVCKADGRVLLLGKDITLKPGSFTILWNNGGAARSPFPVDLPPERRTGVDRLIAVGTTGVMVPLAPLEVSETFADVIASNPRHAVPLPSPVQVLWTATLATLAIERPPVGT